MLIKYAKKYETHLKHQLKNANDKIEAITKNVDDKSNSFIYRFLKIFILMLTMKFCDSLILDFIHLILI